jgi:hypothetical protein
MFEQSGSNSTSIFCALSETFYRNHLSKAISARSYIASLWLLYLYLSDLISATFIATFHYRNHVALFTAIGNFGQGRQHFLNMHAPLYNLLSSFLTHKHIDLRQFMRSIEKAVVGTDSYKRKSHLHKLC